MQKFISYTLFQSQIRFMGQTLRKNCINQSYTQLSNFYMFLYLQIYQATLDKWTPYSQIRWLATGALLILFALRVILTQVTNLFDCFFFCVVELPIPFGQDCTLAESAMAFCNVFDLRVYGPYCSSSGILYFIC